MYCHTFEPEEHRLIRQASRMEGATLNDLLLRDIFLTLRQWNAGRASAAANRWLRIAIPVSLRTGDGTCTSAANSVSYNFVTRDSSQCGDVRALLLGIRRENDVATRGRRSLLFLNSFRFLERIPRGGPPVPGLQSLLRHSRVVEHGQHRASLPLTVSTRFGQTRSRQLDFGRNLTAPPRFAPTPGPRSRSAVMASGFGSVSGAIRGCLPATMPAGCSSFTWTA